MSLPFPVDTSTQLTYSTFGFATPPLDNYATSNFVSNVSNVLRTAINTKQDTLTAATNLLGVGTSITAIDYNKVSVNKPTNFQADWNSTIINKPTIYTQSQIDTFLNAKQNNLTAATTLLGTGGSITGINYNTVINKPTYSLPLNSNATTNTISISLSDYYNQTQVNTAIGNTSNYSLNISNILINNINDNISNLYSQDINVYTPVRQYPSKAYNELTNETTTSFLGKTVYTRTFTLNATGISYGSGVYTMYISSTYTLGPHLTHLLFDYNVDVNSAGAHFQPSAYDATGLYNGTNGIVDGYIGEWVILKLPNPIFFTKLEIISRNGYIYRAPAEWKCYGSNDGGSTFTEITEASQMPRLTAGDYVNNTYTKSFNNLISYSYIGFTFNKIVGDGTTLNFVELKLFGKERIQPFYVSSNVFNSTLINYYNKTEANSLLNAKDAILSFSSPLIRTVNSITFNESSITSLTNFYNKTEANNLLNAKQATLTFSSPLVNTANTINFNESSITTLTNFYNKTEANNLLNAKQATLTFSSPLVNTANTINFNESSITSLTNFYNKTEANNLLNAKDAILSFSSPLIRTVNSITFNESSITSLTNFYNKTEANNLLNAKQANLTFSSPLVNTTNTITFNESSITSLTNFYNKTEANARYLQLTGGDLTGTLNISYANPILTIKATGESQTAILYLSTPSNSSSALKTAIISGGISSWSRSRLHFCLNSNDVSNDVSNNATIADARMSIDPNGSVGIGITTPSARLHIREATGATLGANNGTIMIDHDNSGGASSITFRSAVNRGNDYGYIQYQDAATVLGAGEAAKLIIGTQNDGDDDILIMPSGNVGIGATNPKLNLHIGSTNANHNIGRAILTAGNIHNADKRDFLSIGRWDGASTADWQFTGLKYGVITGAASGEAADNHSCITFHTWGNSISNSREVMRINSRGILSILGNLIYNYLFNNTGENYTNIQNFNDVSHFGYKFIQGTTNGPGTGGGEYYSWYIGLGINFSASSFGCQFALPRNIAKPVLSIRYRESGTWGGWTGITAEALTSGDKTINGNVGIGGASTSYKLEVYGSVFVRGSIGIQSDDLNIYRSSGGIGGNINAGGNITCLLYAITNSGTDYVGVGNATSGNNNNYLRQLYIMFETFTGFHRCFTNDELFDNENPQSFKDTYIGRIVVSTGKIATDFKSIDNDDWEIKYDKEGITIEDALPMIELSRKKKDKRVFGVLGNSKRNNSRSERLIINSVGEGGIWICNSNGNIENGDYITSSDYLGYGEKQDDDLLHNYTVAKATMDCDFQLDSPLYNCIEIQEGLRIAFIAATYHSG